MKHLISILATACALPLWGQADVASVASQATGISQNTAVIPMEKLEPDFYGWHERHEAIIQLIQKEPVDLVFIGDSITHIFGGLPKSHKIRGGKTWDKYYGHRNAINMGFGWDRTQNVIWRLTNGELDGITPKVAVVLIGTNNLKGTENARQNTPAEIAEGVAAICDIIHEKTPNTQILLLGLLPRAPQKFVQSIQQTNDLLAILDQEQHITFLNMYVGFVGQDGLPKKKLMHDTVHPNAKGYQLWAETMEPILSELLGDTPVMPDASHAGELK